MIIRVKRILCIGIFSALILMILSGCGKIGDGNLNDVADERIQNLANNGHMVEVDFHTEVGNVEANVKRLIYDTDIFAAEMELKSRDKIDLESLKTRLKVENIGGRINGNFIGIKKSSSRKVYGENKISCFVSFQMPEGRTLEGEGVNLIIKLEGERADFQFTLDEKLLSEYSKLNRIGRVINIDEGEIFLEYILKYPHKYDVKYSIRYDNDDYEYGELIFQDEDGEELRPRRYSAATKEGYYEVHSYYSTEEWRGRDKEFQIKGIELQWKNTFEFILYEDGLFFSRIPIEVKLEKKIFNEEGEIEYLEVILEDESFVNRAFTMNMEIFEDGEKLLYDRYKGEIVRNLAKDPPYRQRLRIQFYKPLGGEIRISIDDMTKYKQIEYEELF